jgi:hypothetical protein
MTVTLAGPILGCVIIIKRLPQSKLAFRAPAHRHDVMRQDSIITVLFYKKFCI